MKTISMMSMAPVIALSAAAFGVTPEAAKAGPIVPPGHYCMSYDLGGADCSFTSYAQCEATASGQAFATMKIFKAVMPARAPSTDLRIVA